jgi:TatD DNase family protein
MIDTHCHLDLPAFDGDRAEVMARARAAGVTQVVVPAIRPRTWAALVAKCGDGLVPALGIHPQIVPELDDDERHAALARLPAALAAAGACAVGECGLDGGTADQAEQERLFAAQIAIAREQRLPLLVHVLRAHDAAPRLLKANQTAGGIMHSYSGSPELVRVYADLGFAFAFAGPITYARARKPVAAAAAVPEHLILAETDAPDQPPAAHAGQRSEPAFVVDVIAGLAAARGTTAEAMAALTTANARRVLRLH